MPNLHLIAILIPYYVDEPPCTHINQQDKVGVLQFFPNGQVDPSSFKLANLILNFYFLVKFIYPYGNVWLSILA